MKKLSALALALILLTIPVIGFTENGSPESDAFTQEGAEPADAAEDWSDEPTEGSEAEDLADAPEEGAPSEDEAENETIPEPIDPASVSRGAKPLYALIARALTLGATPFDSEPDATTAWALTYAALEQSALEGMTNGHVSQEALDAAYGAIFAVGALPEMPDGFTLLRLEDGLYSVTSDPGDVQYAPYALDAFEENGAVSAEAAVMITTSYTPQDLFALVRVSLTPDAQAPFGARLSGFQPITGAPAMTGAEATTVLPDYKGITYGAVNVLDGKNDTCWAYSEDETPGAVLTLSSVVPETVRGIRLTPAYAKNNRIALANNRVKTFHVALSDGASYDFTVEPDIGADDFARFTSFAFETAHEVTWVSVEVTSVYPGEKYADTCISEIALF